MVEDLHTVCDADFKWRWVTNLRIININIIVWLLNIIAIHRTYEIHANTPDPIWIPLTVFRNLICSPHGRAHVCCARGWHTYHVNCHTKWSGRCPPPAPAKCTHLSCPTSRFLLRWILNVRRSARSFFCDAARWLLSEAGAKWRNFGVLMSVRVYSSPSARVWTTMCVHHSSPAKSQCDLSAHAWTRCDKGRAINVSSFWVWLWFSWNLVTLFSLSL